MRRAQPPNPYHGRHDHPSCQRGRRARPAGQAGGDRPGICGSAPGPAGRRGGLPGGGLRPRRHPHQAPRSRRVAHRRRRRRPAGGRPRRRDLPAHGGSGPAGRLRRGRHLGAHPAQRGQPGPVPHHRRGHPAGGLAASGRHRDPGVHHLPGHHHRAGRTAAGGRVRPGGRPGLPPGLQPRTHRPGQSPVALREHPQGGVGRGRPVAGGGGRLLRPAGQPDRARLVAGRSRADQAVGEHLPPCEHRPGQRAGHVRPRPGHRRVGGHRRRLHQALRLPAVHPRAGRGRPLPADGSVLPVVAGAPVARGAVPVRGAGQRRQRPHARLRRAPPHPGPQPAPTCR